MVAAYYLMGLLRSIKYVEDVNVSAASSMFLLRVFHPPTQCNMVAVG